MRGFGSRFGRRRRYEDLSSSIEEHLAEKVDELMESGLSREEATYTARREFGNATRIEERSREVWQWARLESLWADVKFALRQMKKSPGFTMSAILALALGIGAQTAMFSVIHAVLIDPFPYRGALRIVHIHLYDKNPFPEDLSLTGPQFAQFEKSPVLDGAIAEDDFPRALTGEELPAQVQTGRISPDGFAFFGVPALIGREFIPPDGAHVAVLSYAFWKSHYAARADVIGTTLQLDHENYTIVGVLPQRFAWMGDDLYTPLAYSADPHRIAQVFARTKPFVSDRAAETALEPMIDAFARQTPDNFPQKFRVHVVPINEIAIGRMRGVLVILFVCVSFLLALACVHVAILQLARGEARTAEIALRKALGASRGRILAQLLTESMVLALAGGAGGVALAFAGVRLLRHFLIPLPSLFPPEAQIAVNNPVLVFSAGVAIVSGTAAGLWPAWRAGGGELRTGAEAGSQKLAVRRGTQRSHTTLLAVQAAMTVVLLAGSGATLGRLDQLVHAPLGYDPHHLISLNLVLREGDHHAWANRVAYYAAIRAAIASNPGVLDAAVAESSLPPQITDSTPISVPGRKTAGHIIEERVSGEYFSTLRIPLLDGRIWQPDEVAHAAHLAIVNETMRRLYWPHSSPIGQSIVLNNGRAVGNAWTLVAPGNDNRFQVVGVVGDTPNRGLDEQTAPAVYVPFSMIVRDGFSMVVRTRGEAGEALLHRIREQVHAIDAAQAIGDSRTGESMLEGDSLGRERFLASLFGAFALLGAAFALSGFYSVQSYFVAQRRREFGVRLALGAPRMHIVGLVTRRCLIALTAGATAGIGISIAFAQMFTGWTNGNPRDPAMLAAAVMLLLAGAAAASVIPARLAVAVDPMQALRNE